jgi:hypothetical protein
MLYSIPHFYAPLQVENKKIIQDFKKQFIESFVSASLESKKTWIIEPSLFPVDSKFFQTKDSKTDQCKKYLLAHDFKVIEFPTAFCVYRIFKQEDTYPLLDIETIRQLSVSLNISFSELSKNRLRKILDSSGIKTIQHEKYWRSIFEVPPSENISVDISKTSTESQNLIVDYGISTFTDEGISKIKAFQNSFSTCFSEDCIAKNNIYPNSNFLLLSDIKNKEKIRYYPTTSHLAATYDRFSSYFIPDKNRAKQILNNQILTVSIETKNIKSISDTKQINLISPQDNSNLNIEYVIFEDKHIDMKDFFITVKEISGYSISKTESGMSYYISHPKPQRVTSIFELQREMRRTLPKTVIRYFESRIPQKTGNINLLPSALVEFPQAVNKIQVDLSSRIASSINDSNFTEGKFQTLENETQILVSNHFVSHCYDSLLYFYAKTPQSFCKFPPTGIIHIKSAGGDSKNKHYMVETLGDDFSGYAFVISR